MRSPPRATDLLQHIDGVELPATGRWDILPSPSLSVDHRRGRRVPDLVSITGVLAIADGQPAMQLDLRARSHARPAIDLDYSGRLTSADRYGHWEFHGQARDGTTRIERLRLCATYHGVFAHGADPVVLLEVRVEVDRRIAKLHLRGEINLQRPDQRETAMLGGGG